MSTISVLNLLFIVS